jgi:hypothetical protein
MTNKKSSLLLFLFAWPLLISCGSGGGGSSSGSGTNTNNLTCAPDGVPRLSYSLSPTTLRNGQKYTESVSYCDSDGDIREVKFTIGLIGGLQVTSSLDAAEEGITGTSGSSTQELTWDSNAPAGTYQVTFWLEDARGNQSNSVTVTITLTAKAPQAKVFSGSPGPEKGIIINALKKPR